MIITRTKKNGKKLVIIKKRGRKYVFVGSKKSVLRRAKRLVSKGDYERINLIF